MTNTAFKDCLETLKAQARDASRAEGEHQNEAARRTVELRKMRECLHGGA